MKTLKRKMTDDGSDIAIGDLSREDLEMEITQGDIDLEGE